MELKLEKPACAVVGILFVLSASLKATGSAFFNYLAGTRMFPADLVHMVGWSVILSEVAIAVMLAWPALRRLGWLACAALCSAFAAFHAFAVVIGDLPACPCLGFQITRHRLISHLVLGTICICIAVLAGFYYRRRPAPSLPVLGITPQLEEA